MKLLKKIFFVIVCLIVLFLTVSCEEETKTQTVIHTTEISSTWKVNKDKHWHESKDNTTLYDEGSHELELVKTEEATCLANGYKLYKCKVCGYIHEEVISALDHDIKKVKFLDATCDTDGCLEHYECTLCHKCFSDAYGNNEVTIDSLTIVHTGHELVHIDAVEASYYTTGYPDCYYCSVCDQYYETKECSSIAKLTPQKVASVSVAKTLPVDSIIKVRGVVAGYACTNAAENCRNVIILKDESSNTCMGLNCPDGSLLGNAIGSYSEIHAPIAIGSIIELKAIVVKSNVEYATGNAGIIFLQNADTTGKITDYVVGKGSASFDLTSNDITTISTQSEFFQFLGHKNGLNTGDTTNYDYNILGANAFKIIKLENLRAVRMSSDDKNGTLRTSWRPMFDITVNTWAKSSISNSTSSTNKIGAHQSYYPVFYDYNTYVNCGTKFSDLVFGSEAVANAKQNDWTNHLTTDKTVYAMYVGGSDYFAQFVILSTDWVVSK